MRSIIIKSSFVLVIAIIVAGVFHFTLGRVNQPVVPISVNHLVEESPQPEIKQSPVVPISSSEDTVWRVQTDEKVVALTFDADMFYGTRQLLLSGKWQSLYDDRIIAELELKKIPATIFVTGLWAEVYSKELERIAANPLFEIGNHSYDHPSFVPYCSGMTPIPDSADAMEIDKTDTLLKKYAGASYKPLFRFPGLCNDAYDKAEVIKRGYTIVAADADGHDGWNMDTVSIVNRVLSKVHPGSIILFHFQGGLAAPKTFEALPYIISALEKDGYTFVKVTDLLKLQKPEIKKP